MLSKCAYKYSYRGKKRVSVLGESNKSAVSAMKIHNRGVKN